MGAQKASSLLLKLGDDSSPQTFTAIAGLRTKNITVNNETVDVTSADDVSKQRQLLQGAGIQSFSASGSGVFKDGAPSDSVNAAAVDQTHLDWQIVVPGLGTFEGKFQVSSLQYAGEHNGEVTYDLSLESAGDIAFTAD